jgi:hypothetical protein
MLQKYYGSFFFLFCSIGSLAVVTRSFFAAQFSEAKKELRQATPSRGAGIS